MTESSTPPSLPLNPSPLPNPSPPCSPPPAAAPALSPPCPGTQRRTAASIHPAASSRISTLPSPLAQLIYNPHCAEPSILHRIFRNYVRGTNSCIPISCEMGIIDLKATFSKLSSGHDLLYYHPYSRLGGSPNLVRRTSRKQETQPRFPPYLPSSPPLFALTLFFASLFAPACISTCATST